jgi:uncharacterized SAM-binding protein YcdF (DUF218 family)
VFYFLSKRLDVLFSPYTWALVLLALALPWRRRSFRTWKRKRVMGAVGLGLLVVLAVPAVAEALTRAIERVPRTYREDVTYDAVVLLGGVTNELVMKQTGQPAYNDNVERLVMTFKLLREGRARVAIVSGAASDPALERFGEARVLAEQLVAWGIDPARIIVEPKARNTRENAIYCAEIVRQRGAKDVLVVTSAFHVPRALDTFRAVDLPVDVLPVDYRAPPEGGGELDLFPRASDLGVSSRILREALGRVVYRFVGFGK